jgi:hypothetical protein
VTFTAEVITRRKVAALAAFGLEDKTIADALLLTVPAVELIKLTPEYLQAYSEKTNERLNRAMDVEEGWDAVEEAAIAKTMDALKYNADPRFALQAAAVANRAVRRTPTAHKVLDASRSNAMIILSMNKKYIDGVTTTEQSATIIVEGPATNAPKKRVDMPSPSRVAQLLSLTGAELGAPRNEMAEFAARHGIDADLLDE